MTGGLVELDGVSVDYGSGPTRVRAVDDVTLDVPAGSTTAIIGPSGCGKSTLLRAIAGLEPLAAGRVAVGGRDLRGVPPHERGLGLMFQDHALFDHLDVAGNVAFGPQRQGWAAARIEARVDEVLALVDLGGFGPRAVSSLSGGEAQRVALARALAPEPAVLMLDEPLGSLDRVLRAELVDQLRAVIDQLDATVVHVTHDQQEAFALADEVVVMRDGAIVQRASPEDLWRRPVDRFVANFVGHPDPWRIDDGWLVVPPVAVSEDAEGSEQAVVVRSTFRDGTYDVVGRLADGRSIEWTSGAAREPGTTVSLRIDPERTIRLVD